MTDRRSERIRPWVVEVSESRDDDGLTLDGYVSVFNEPYAVHASWENGGRRFNEIIAPGAFAKTLSEGTPVLQFDHGKHPMIGSIPLGRFTKMEEDARGLRVRARLSDNWLIEPIRDAIRDGSIEGMSFQFAVPEGKDEWDRTGDIPLRIVREVRLFEAGPVVWPASKHTSVGVRSQMVEMMADPQFRRALAEAISFGTPDEAAREGTSDEAAAAVKVMRPNPARVRVLREKASELKGDSQIDNF